MESLLRFELDKDGEVGVTLAKLESLTDMDQFMRRFQNSNAVKNEYLDAINAFLQKDIAEEFLIKNMDKRENNGYLRLYVYDEHKYCPVPILYHCSLIEEKEAINKLKEAFLKDSVLREIYNKKIFILPPPPTNFLKDELCRAIFRNGTKEVFIKEFIRYFKGLSEEKRYFILRSICVKCDLLDNPRDKSKNAFHIKRNILKHKKDSFVLVKVKHYAFGDFSDEELSMFEMEAQKAKKNNPKPEISSGDKEFAPDVHFTQALISGNDEELFGMYDLDEIHTYTNKLGGKK